MLRVDLFVYTVTTVRFGLDGLLREQGDRLYGIMNGVDSEQWDSSKDHYLPQTYGPSDLSGKVICMEGLQKAIDFYPKKSFWHCLMQNGMGGGTTPGTHLPGDTFHFIGWLTSTRQEGRGVK